MNRSSATSTYLSKSDSGSGMYRCTLCENYTTTVLILSKKDLRKNVGNSLRMSWYYLCSCVEKLIKASVSGGIKTSYILLEPVDCNHQTISNFPSSLSKYCRSLWLTFYQSSCAHNIDGFFSFFSFIWLEKKTKLPK